MREVTKANVKRQMSDSVLCLLACAGLISVFFCRISLAEIIPEGHSGIAARYPGDAGIVNDPNVLLAEDFETRGIENLVGYWTGMGNTVALSIASDSAPKSNGSRSLQNSAERGQSTGGKLYKILGEKYDELYVRLYVKFAHDYGFNHHFCKLGTVMGGGAGQLPVDKFWTGLEPATKLGHYYPATYYPPPGLWHFYTYWPHMKSWQTPEGEPDGRSNPYYGNNFAPRVPTFVTRDEWICIEYMIRVNSNPADPDNCDGAQRFWINGVLTGDWSPGNPIGYWYRDTFRLAPEDHRSAPFEGYRWRDNEWVKNEYFKIENYVSESAFAENTDYKNDHPNFVINDQVATCWFDNVVIATSYIGPIYLFLDGDINYDNTVDSSDMELLTGNWLEKEPLDELEGDINDDNSVDFFDFALLARNWLESTEPD